MVDYPLPTLAAQITDSGISAPSFADIRASLRATFLGIFGSDAYIAPDSQDGQWIDAISKAIDDCNASCIAVYNAFSPSTAKGAGLASVVKINGIAKMIPSQSTCDVDIGGTVGTEIVNGVISDGTTKWALPASVIIPDAGTITVTATCLQLGAVQAPATTLIKIETPTQGWQTVNNAFAATPGSPVETDAALRRRQSESTALASVTPIKGLKGNLYNVPGVTELEVYENDTDTTDANSIPPHTVAVVINGGDAQVIADTILAKKTLGASTLGSTSEISRDPYGVPKTIKFSRSTDVPIDVHLTLHALDGYTSTIGASVVQALVDYVNSLNIGEDVYWMRLLVPANLGGLAGSETFEITALTICLHAGSPAAADIPVAYNATASLTAAHTYLTVT